jgi:hypothetical protein
VQTLAQVIPQLSYYSITYFALAFIPITFPKTHSGNRSFNQLRRTVNHGHACKNGGTTYCSWLALAFGLAILLVMVRRTTSKSRG